MILACTFTMILPYVPTIRSSMIYKTALRFIDVAVVTGVHLVVEQVDYYLRLSGRTLYSSTRQTHTAVTVQRLADLWCAP